MKPDHSNNLDLSCEEPLTWHLCSQVMKKASQNKHLSWNEFLSPSLKGWAHSAEN